MMTNVPQKPADHDEQQSSSLQMVDDLLPEILLRLPMKSLFRFRTVSKKWDSLITGPQFRLQRFNPNPNPPIGFFFYCRDLDAGPWYEYVPYNSSLIKRGSSYINPPFRRLKFTGNDSKIVQSCNGLLLCWSYRRSDPKYLDYYVYNPTTSKIFTKFEELAPESIAGISLAFDPAKSPYYKLVWVQMLKGYTPPRFQIWVYSYKKPTRTTTTTTTTTITTETSSSTTTTTKTDRYYWRFCGESFTGEVDFGKGVYWNGAVHWVNMETRYAQYFNPDDPIIPPQEMPVLPAKDNGDESYFGESCDHLHYVVGTRHSLLIRLYEVYEMKRDYSEWLLKYRVDTSSIVAKYPPEKLWDGGDSYSLVAMVRGGKREEDAFLVLQVHGKLVRYNLVYKTFETIYELPDSQIYEFANAMDQLLGVQSRKRPISTTNVFHYIESVSGV